MASVRDHYEKLLGHYYHYFAPTLDDALISLEALGIPKAAKATRAAQAVGAAGSNARALDLGCGTGVYTEALRELGYDAAGIDTCQVLVDKARVAYPECYFAESDILSYQPKLPVDVCLMLGDTVAHMPSLTAINALVKSMADHIAPGGVWLTTFTEFEERKGAERFVDVVASDDLTLSCFLEREGDYYLTTDLVRVKTNGWRLEKSRYRKLIIKPAMLSELFAAVGFSAEVVTAEQNMTAVIARKPVD